MHPGEVAIRPGLRMTGLHLLALPWERGLRQSTNCWERGQGGMVRGYAQGGGLIFQAPKETLWTELVSEI